VQDHRLPSDQPLELVRQLGGGWQGCAADQDRDHADVAGQRPGQLQAHIVIGLQQAGSALRGCRGQPAWTDDRQDGVTAVQGAIDGNREVLARGNGHHVLEHAVGAQARAERIGQAAGVPWDITAPVAQEDLQSHAPSRPARQASRPGQHSRAAGGGKRATSKQARSAADPFDLPFLGSRWGGRADRPTPGSCGLQAAERCAGGRSSRSRLSVIAAISWKSSGLLPRRRSFYVCQLREALEIASFAGHGGAWRRSGSCCGDGGRGRLSGPACGRVPAG
jgi:hypothetical protein